MRRAARVYDAAALAACAIALVIDATGGDLGAVLAWSLAGVTFAILGRRVA